MTLHSKNKFFNDSSEICDSGRNKGKKFHVCRGAGVGNSLGAGWVIGWLGAWVGGWVGEWLGAENPFKEL